eukprot:PLAT9030.2.p1 GENE.PLAT9030.2~~PLAT9030.2.p1  ORF type:complete len:752 (-),score=273.89 PLAT9030.2:61-2316(-)
MAALASADGAPAARSLLLTLCTACTAGYAVWRCPHAQRRSRHTSTAAERLKQGIRRVFATHRRHAVALPLFVALPRCRMRLLLLTASPVMQAEQPALCGAGQVRVLRALRVFPCAQLDRRCFLLCAADGVPICYHSHIALRNALGQTLTVSALGEMRWVYEDSKQPLSPASVFQLIDLERPFRDGVISDGDAVWLALCRGPGFPTWQEGSVLGTSRTVAGDVPAPGGQLGRKRERLIGQPSPLLAYLSEQLRDPIEGPSTSSNPDGLYYSGDRRFTALVGRRNASALQLGRWRLSLVGDGASDAEEEAAVLMSGNICQLTHDWVFLSTDGPKRDSSPAAAAAAARRRAGGASALAAAAAATIDGSRAAAAATTAAARVAALERLPAPAVVASSGLPPRGCWQVCVVHTATSGGGSSGGGGGGGEGGGGGVGGEAAVATGSGEHHAASSGSGRAHVLRRAKEQLRSTRERLAGGGSSSDGSRSLPFPLHMRAMHGEIEERTTAVVEEERAKQSELHKYFEGRFALQATRSISPPLLLARTRRLEKPRPWTSYAGGGARAATAAPMRLRARLDSHGLAPLKSVGSAPQLQLAGDMPSARSSLCTHRTAASRPHGGLRAGAAGEDGKRAASEVQLCPLCAAESAALDLCKVDALVLDDVQHGTPFMLHAAVTSMAAAPRRLKMLRDKAVHDRVRLLMQREDDELQRRLLAAAEPMALRDVTATIKAPEALEDVAQFHTSSLLPNTLQDRLSHRM